MNHEINTSVNQALDSGLDFLFNHVAPFGLRNAKIVQEMRAGALSKDSTRALEEYLKAGGLAEKITMTIYTAKYSPAESALRHDALNEMRKILIDAYTGGDEAFRQVFDLFAYFGITKEGDNTPYIGELKEMEKNFPMRHDNLDSLPRLVQ